VGRPHALLLRAARHEVTRRRDALPHFDAAELDDIAVQSADDALLTALSKLDQFRGTGRFTTWAYKFALLEAAIRLRRRPWQEREIPSEPRDWPQLTDGRSPDTSVEQAHLLAAVGAAMQTRLPPANESSS
jgi:RNA polymerase sigma-70 factor (ECF subfamily)